MMKLGGQGLEVSAQGFGCMGITAFYGAPMEDEAAIKLLMDVHAAGVTHFDTAEIYRSGNPMAPPTEDTKWNETVVGKFVAKVGREKVTIATKYLAQAHAGGTCSFENVSGAVDASLVRLGVDCIDLYYLHRLPDDQNVAEFMHSAKKLIEMGKIKYVGLSEVSSAKIREAHSITPLTCVQQEWSLLTRIIEGGVVQTCVELGIGVVAYSPLARNLLSCKPLTETPKDFRATVPRYSAENLAKSQGSFAAITALAKEKNVSAATLSLAWLHNKAKQFGVSFIPIPGTTKFPHFLDNWGALSIELSVEAMQQLETLALEVAGERGDEQYKGRALEGQGGV